MFRNLFIFSFLLALTNCAAPGTAFLGPSITAARTGSIYQAGLSYGSNHVIQKTKDSFVKIQEAKTVVYTRVNQLNKKIKDESNKVALKKQANLFFTAVKDNLKQ
jgi:hypothetical protein